jgi:translation initiation factor IF-1
MVAYESFLSGKMKREGVRISLADAAVVSG